MRSLKENIFSLTQLPVKNYASQSLIFFSGIITNRYGRRKKEESLEDCSISYSVLIK